MDGMCARNSSLKVVIFLAILLMPFVISGISFSKPISMNEPSYKGSSAASCSSIFIAGNFQYFGVKLTSEAQRFPLLLSMVIRFLKQKIDLLQIITNGNTTMVLG